MNICKTTHQKCSECNLCCSTKINENQVAIDILKFATDLLLAIEFDDKNYIEINIDKIEDHCKYFKKVFKL